jgi:photosystem II stability/assembly factor-like uncharacterized protein
MNVSPWLGAVLIAIGCGAAVAFHYAHLDAVTLPTLIVTAGVAVFQASMHAAAIRDKNETKQELVTLRASMRPSASQVDPEEKRS